MTGKIVAIRPGQEHAFNNTPHFNTYPVIKLDAEALKPLVFKLKDGRLVKVYPMNNSFAQAGTGFYSKLFIDEYAEKGGEFQPVEGKNFRFELIKELYRQHKLNLERF